MNVRVIPLLGALSIGGLAAIPISGQPPVSNSPVIRANWNNGVMPVPGQGPPGAVAGVGAYPIMGQVPGITIPNPAPLVAGKFLLPKGVRVTVFPGSELSRMYEAPLVIGMRPGYIFRFELSGLPYVPNKSLYPEVQIRNALVPRHGMKYMDYPIPLVFTQEDIDRALRGGLVTKVIYLEDPEKALPSATYPDFPVETLDFSESEAIKNANSNGRMIAIVRLGDRKPTIQELQTVANSGTLLLPDQKYLKAPHLPPVFQYWSVPFYDPLLGSKIPTEECFPNGGDKKDRMGIGPEDQLGGLNPTDVGVTFTLNNKRRVVTSNVTSICAPRFLIRRVEEFANIYDSRQIIAEQDVTQSLGAIKERMAPMTDIAKEKANELAGRMRPSIYIGKVGPGLFIGTNKPIAIGQISGTKVEGALVEPEQLTASPSLGPLTVTKLIDPSGPRQPGDVVTITIKYANTGFKEISDLIVSDSLSGRLEYIQGSAQTDRAANFSTAENEAGSVLLRWELPGELLPGQAGTIKFKAKVR